VNQKKRIEAVTIRFAGDSGDGMQLVGDRYAQTSAIVGNDLSTLPDFPAEIRAPAGSLAGVSGFQLQFSSQTIFTPGDRPNVLVAMNPAALQRNFRDVHDNGLIIVDAESFTDKNLRHAGFQSNPLEDGTLSAWQVYPAKITELTRTALADTDLSNKQVMRCRNFCALGMMFWLYSRPLDPTLGWLESKFPPVVAEANKKVLKTGYHFGETAGMFQVQYEVLKAPIEPGKYRKIDGTQALAFGLVVGAQKAGLDLVYGTYPITPASGILHALAKLKHQGIRTVQCEDEIAAASLALGASYGGAIGVTASSGPGISLKGEVIGLATMVEIPMIILSIQRGGPSTGLPTKTEQADLMQSLFGRNGESPLPVIAASTPSDCFHSAIEAVRVAVQHMTPVILLSDGYLSNGSEPWKIPNVDDIDRFDVNFHEDPEDFLPYARNENLVRPWVRPGTPGLEHRVGGLEKDDGSGHVSYDPDNHERMTHLRAERIEKIAENYPKTEVFGQSEGRLLVVSWGSTFGSTRAAILALQDSDRDTSIGHVHLRHLHPLPNDLRDILSSYDTVVVPEMNRGQLAFVLRAHCEFPILSITKIKGQPFLVDELTQRFSEILSTPIPEAAE
jgi:2-oxoglutarate/2-oxoacid ferredoxin oxidoreductase subunit alpha